MSPTFDSNFRTSSDNSHSVAFIGLGPVMASSDTQNVVNSSQSIGEPSPVDVHANQNSTASAGNGTAPTISQTNDTTLASSNAENPPAVAASIESIDSHSNSHDTLPEDDAGSRALSALNSSTTSELANGNSVSTEQSEENGSGELEVLKDSTNIHEDSTAGDSNVGSDTDTSRADSTEQSKDAQGNIIRSGSIKKPTTFKSVSITKSFLAKTAAVPPAAKVGDKGRSIITCRCNRFS